jgi:transcriptional regulator with XRE-family HTH domain
MTISLPTLPAGIVPAFTYGDRLRKARELAGFERAQFASELGVHRQSIARYEHDDAEPSRPVVVLWGLLTQVDVEWLMTGECTPRDSNSEPTGLESEIFSGRSAVISDGAGNISVRRRHPAPRPLSLDAGTLAAELGLSA